MLQRKIILPAMFLLAAVPGSMAANGEPLVRASQSAADSNEQLLRLGVAAYQRGDYVAASGHFRKLAAREVASAETMLGVMSSRGLGVARDQAVAAAWFLRASNRGYAPAQLALADAYARGRGVKTDKPRAILLARAAAAQNQPGAAQLVLREGPEQTAMLTVQP